MTKEEKMPTERMAIAICDRMLGPIERDPVTLDALEVARVCTLTALRLEQLNPIYLAGVVDERSMSKMNGFPGEIMGIGDDVVTGFDGVEKVIRAELVRRHLFGRDVRGKLTELTDELLGKIT